VTSPIDALRAALADRYEIDREVGADDLRTVYHARDMRLTRDVRLSVVRPSLAASLGAARFLNATARLGRIRHPWVTQFIEAGDLDGTLWFATTAPEGESLRERLTRDGTLPIDLAVRLTRSAAQALQFVHEEKFVHGALTTDHIFVTHEGEVAICDVGLAHAIAPETACDARGDQRALAAIAIEMLTGAPPAIGASGLQCARVAPRCRRRSTQRCSGPSPPTRRSSSPVPPISNSRCALPTRGPSAGSR
jgi:serine/threonine-protein kinase